VSGSTGGPEEGTKAAALALVGGKGTAEGKEARIEAFQPADDGSGAEERGEASMS